MHVTFYLFQKNSPTPINAIAEWDELKDELPEAAYITNVVGKWYLEYETNYGTVRIVDVNDERLSRERDTLEAELLRLGVRNATSRDIPNRGVTITLRQLSNFREIVYSVDPNLLLSAVSYNDRHKEFNLLDDEYLGAYRIVLIDGVEPKLDPDDFPKANITVSAYLKLYKED